MKSLWIFVITIFRICYADSLNNEETWTGRWFPERSTVSTNYGGDKTSMGIQNPDCDDAKTKLETDWKNDSVEYTCYDIRSRYFPNYETHPIYEIENIPIMYKAAHVCMNESITYDHVIPTYGTHRPLWPKWGEYTFVPKQRWLHSLEHGGIVMLYHPCANTMEIEKLKKIVETCLYRHVITPYRLLSTERPLALVAWGRRLQMSVVSKKIAVQFIKEAALQGAEHTAKDGQYSLGLIKHSKFVTNESDETLCPNF